jgi:hypothetical protein
MASESGFNPVPVLVHVVAIAVGLYLGFVVMDAIAPDLPGADVEPGVSSSVAPEQVAGDDPDSLFLAANLGPALAELDDQLAAGEGVVSLHIEPGAMDADTGTGDDLIDPEDVAPELPLTITGAIDAERDGRTTLADVSFMDLVATAKGPRWYVQLDIARDIGPPPWTYTAPFEGAPVSPGGAPPKPVGG